MAMYSQQLFSGIRFIQHDIVRSGKTSGVRYIEADPEHAAAIYSIRVWVLEAEGRYAGADAVKVLSTLPEVLGGFEQERRCVLRGRGDALALGVAEALEDCL